MYRLPPRQAIFDPFEGHLLRIGETTLLSHQTHPLAETLASGVLVVRYGIVYLGRSYLSIVPELVALDSGGGYSGEEAWDFLFNKSNLFPRADVVGYRDDGQEDMITVKSLDLMYPVRLWVYGDMQAHQPLAQAQVIIHPQRELLATRLQTVGNFYSTVEEWQKQHE